jgi:serine/alanine adding enzyme
MIFAERRVAALQLTLSIRPGPGSDWDEYVRARPASSAYLLSGWTLVAKAAFGHEAFFVEARATTGVLRGVLPLVRQKSLIFGDFVTSIPFFNYGGALGDSDEIACLLMDYARDLVSGLGCSYIEFRDAVPRGGDWLVRTDKVAMILDLPADAAELSQRLSSKLKSQIKRAERESVSVQSGGGELLADFYDVFCRNMRDLGTPVYPRRFFEEVLTRFPSECALIVVRRAMQPAAAGFLVCAAGRAEIPWAACRDDAKAAGFNMRLYWEALTAAISRGCTEFDFGRSTVDSGTYRFKKQWGAQPRQLYWHRWQREAVSSLASEGRLMRCGVFLWQRLPLRIANALGPLLSPSLPW